MKKQQQQELDRQRNLERDFDTATERHKKIIESYDVQNYAVILITENSSFKLGAIIFAVFSDNHNLMEYPFDKDRNKCAKCYMLSNIEYPFPTTPFG